MIYTHIGYRDVGYIHGARLYGHRDYRGKRHALMGSENIHSGAAYKSLCGATITADHDGERFNVWPLLKGMDVGAGVTCKRCKRVIQAIGLETVPARQSITQMGIR